MTLNYEEEGAIKLPFACEDLAAEIAQTALDYIGCPYETEISLLLTTNEEIHKMNLQFRQVDGATDVLSFPMIDYEAAGQFDFLEDCEDCFHPETGELLLGDIVISKEKVLSQAEEYGHSPRREFAFLVTHSVLHLTGYDHIDEKDREVMEQLQREILEKAGIPR